MVVPAGITLFNLHRIIQYSAKYKDDLGIEHAFFVNKEKYGSGVGSGVGSKGRTSDRKTRLMQLFTTTGEYFEYVYGHLKMNLCLEAMKKGDEQKLDWLPRLCTGSKGKFPPEISCSDFQLIKQHKAQKEINIDKINKILMHERFGANQKTNQSDKRLGPSILCQSNEPNSTIALIYKRPIEVLSDFSESSHSTDSGETGQ